MLGPVASFVQQEAVNSHIEENRQLTVPAHKPRCDSAEY